MRLLYAFPEPLPLPRARGVQVAYAIDSLAQAGGDIILAYVPEGELPPLAPTGKALPAGVKLRPLSRGWPSPLDRVPPFSRWHSVRWFARRLSEQIKETSADALYIRHLKLAWLLLSRPEMPLIYEAHEVFADTSVAKRRERVAAMERQVIEGVAAVVCNSQATADRLIALYGRPRRLLVLPNGVASPAVLPDKPWVECHRRIIYAGSFFGWKGVDDLVAAARELPGFRITLIGGEPEQLERLRSRLSAEATPTGAEIELLPRLPHTEVMGRLASACIAVLPNRADTDSAFTSPIKLFEYMAAGCAIVASDLPAIREILHEDEACWFRAGDPQGLANALRDCCAQPAVAQAAGQRLREKSAAYTWTARAERLRAFIEETVAAGPNSSV